MAGYCKWAQACTNPGPWLAWIDGAFYECTEPDKADRPLYCALHAREFKRVKVKNTIGQFTQDGEQRVYDDRANPYLLFCRRCIDTAIDDAKETNPATGEPTDEAMLDRLWLEWRPDHSDPEDYYGSFEWCCHWLSLDVESERKDAIDEVENSLARRLLAVKRAEWNRRKDAVLYQSLTLEQQQMVRMAQMLQMKQSQLVMEF
jgi:hypothetical protein